MGGSGVRRSLRTLFVAAAAVLAAGCYTYVAVEPGAVPPGAEVLIHVDKSVALSVGEVPLPENGGHTVRGTLVAGPSADTLACSVLLQPWGVESGSRALRGIVSIPMGAVEDVQVRRLAKARTATVAGVGVALAWVLVANAFDIHNSKEGTDPTGNVDNALITLFRLRW